MMKKQSFRMRSQKVEYEHMVNISLLTITNELSDGLIKAFEEYEK